MVLIGGFLMIMSSTTEAFQGYNVIVTTDPVSQAALLANTTNEFIAKVTPNPLVANTYQITLFGLNPAYVAPSTTSCFQLSVPVDTTTLNADLSALILAGPQVIQDPIAYGFASGEEYNNNTVENMVGEYGVNCSSPTAFNLTQTGVGTFDRSTCQDTISTIENALFELNLSTPTPLPVVQ
jgi:hypothetical protein